MLCNLKFR